MIKDREGALLSLLGALVESRSPIGSRAANAHLEKSGYKLSESSTSRLLRELDERGWTIPMGSKGRIASSDGRKYWQARTRLAKGGSSPYVVDIRDLRDLVELLEARKAVESAAAEDAARNASPDDIRALRSLARQHHTAIGGPDLEKQPGLLIHRKIASIGANKMLRMLSDVLLAPSLDPVEAVLDIIMGANEEQSMIADHHDLIIDAIEEHDGEKASRLMVEHIGAMVIEANRHIALGNGKMVSRLLEWAENTAARGE